MLQNNQESSTTSEALRHIADAPIKEGGTTRAIEKQTAKVPSLGFLSLAVGSMAVSAALILTKRKEAANFVGLWAPSLLIMGLYNKMVKIERELGFVQE
jgi:hypothetical protein